ncbi:MAG: hypothetical protein JO002_02525 [Burkholderiaceae bacterium]|nr:hypothetical protein [Burkholderiaceae bacterium]
MNALRLENGSRRRYDSGSSTFVAPAMQFRLMQFAFAFTLPILAATDAPAQTQPAATPPAVKRDKIDPLTPAKKRVVDAFVDSLELAANWPHYVDEAQPAFAEDVRAGIVEGAQLDRLPADKRARVDAVVDEMIPHIVEDMKVELLKVDAVTLYRRIGYQAYGKHLTTAELKDLTAIYSSPVYHRAMPVILEQRKTKPDTSDEELRKLVGDEDFDVLVKLLHKPGYSKLLAVAPAAQEMTGEAIGAVVREVSERVGKNYSPILLEKIRQIMDEPAQEQPTSVQVNSPAAPERATQ